MSKVKFGLSNVYFSLITITDGVCSFSTPVKHAGAVNLSLQDSASENIFYADNIRYYRSFGGQGYTGTMEFAKMSDWFKENVLKETLVASDNVLVENAKDNPVPFAMLYQVDDDEGEALRVLYYVEASRIPIDASTKTDTTEPQTDTVDITVSPMPDTFDIKASTTDTTPTAIKEAWFSAVYRPTSTPATT